MNNEKEVEETGPAAINAVIADARLPVPQTVVAQKLYTKLPEIGRMCIGVDPSHFLGVCISEANSLRLSMGDRELSNPHLISSFVKSVFNAAIIGLVPGSALGHCYFIPFKNSKIPGKPRVIQLVPGYRGYLQLGFATGYLVQCDPQVVLDGEHVDVWHEESGPKMKHTIPVLTRPLPDRSNIRGVYCTYRVRNGGESFAFMTRGEIDKIDTGDNVWSSDFHAMCLKSPIRRASKMWQLSRQLASAVRLDEQQEAGLIQDHLGPRNESGPVETLDFDTLVTENAGDDETPIKGAES